MLWIVLAIVVIVVLILLIRLPTEEETSASSLNKLESRRSKPTSTPDSSLDEFRRERHPEKYHERN